MYRYSVSFKDDACIRPEWGAAAAASKIKRIEFSCSQSTPVQTLTRAVAALEKLQKDGAVEVSSIHIPFGAERWNIAHLDETQRQANVRDIQDFMKRVDVLGSKLFTIHGSGEPIPEEDRPRSIAQMRKSLAELTPAFEERGAFLNVEILPRTCIGRTAEDLLSALEGLPETIGVNFDVNHLCGHPEAVPDGIRLLSKRIRALHLSDYDGVDECHWYPGAGVLDWTGILNAVKSIDHDVLLIFEVTHISAAAWQHRQVAPELLFRAAENSAFFIENAAELTRRQKEFQF